MKRFLVLFLLGHSFQLFSMSDQPYNVTFIHANNNYCNKDIVTLSALGGQFGLNLALFANQPLFSFKNLSTPAQVRATSGVMETLYYEEAMTGSLVATVPLTLIASKYPTNAYMSYMTSDSKQAAYNLGMFVGLSANQVLLSAGPAQTGTLPSPVKGALYSLSTAATLHEAHQQFKNSKQYWQNNNYLAAAGHLTLSAFCVGAAALPFYLNYSHRRIS